MSLRATRDDAFRRRVGNRLRNARLDMGLTCEEASSALGVSRACVTMAEIGSDGPGLELLVRMVQLYSVTADYILCLID